MRLLLLDNYDSFTWNLYHALARINPDIDVVRNDHLTVDEATHWDGLVISPGPGLPEESGILMQLLPRYAGTKPVLGICLGHQALAMHYGAALCQLAEVVHGRERRCLITDASDPVYAGLGDVFIAGRYHSWIIDRNTVPESLVVTSTNEQGEVMSFRHTEHPSWGIQYHPESIMTPDGGRIIENWLRHCCT